ncbi:MAG: hypothetical protein PVJ95_10125 [Cellvibrionales bacterium]
MTKNIVTKTIRNAMGTVTVMTLAACGSDQMPVAEVVAPAANTNIAVAKEWVTAMSTGKAEGLAAVEALMAEDGQLYRRRYVGFGFTWDPADEEGRMIVGTVTPESPAAAVLQPGDQFVSVRGIEVNEENMDKLDFRGKPGEVVEAVILRDGEMMDISVARGVIDTPISKTQALAWMQTGNADTWVPDSWELREAIGDGNVVYVWTQSVDTDETSGLPVDTHTVTRFQFNDAGEVMALGNLTEDRFALEQAGWTISR